MDIYWNIFTMHGSINVKFPNNTSKWQMEFNSAFKGLTSAKIHSFKFIQFISKSYRTVIGNYKTGMISKHIALI
jgi:hypothetical protein